MLYDNGPLVTGPGAGFGGADTSLMQNSLGLTTFGFGHALSSGLRVADDFTVPASGWLIDEITFFGYQTGSTTTSTFDHVNLRIWDGEPGQPGSMVVFGDTATNRFVSTNWTNAYRVNEATPTGNTRPLMAVVAAVNTFLPAGNYWLDWQTGGTLASGPWVAPVSILGQTAKPGANALQFDPTGAGTWNPAIDNGAAQARQDLPFVISGSLPEPCDLPSDVSWLSVLPDNGTTLPGESSVAVVSFDSTGLQLGSYQANLCVLSNDPDAGPGNGTELVVVPVTLEVEANPAIELQATVGIVDGVCAATPEIAVKTGATVYHCYTVTNTGDVPLPLHDLNDTQLGNVFTGLNFVLNPGASVNTVAAGLSLPQVVNTSVTSTATWTAYDPDLVGVTATETASATVTVLQSDISLTATVGTTPGVCAASNAISVKEGATVYYCYTVANIGESTLNLHDLADTQLGAVFTGFPFALAPGASVSTVAAGLSLSAVINSTTTSTATWTAYNAGPIGVTSAQASATVTVLPTSIALAATVGTDAGVCASDSAITVTVGTAVYWCYTVTNTGQATLNLHDLTDTALGSILSGFNFALAPGASVNTVAAGLSLTQTANADLVNTSTWTAYNAGPIGNAVAQASTAVTVTFPADVSGDMSVSGQFFEGGVITYTVLLNNTGPGEQGDNAGDEFVNLLPASLTLTGATASSGNAETAGNLMRWNGSIAAGGSVTLQITATINAGAAGTMIENQGLISYDATGDGNNDATRLTDWPESGEPEDPTMFEVQVLAAPALPIPTLSMWGMMLLLMMMLLVVAYRQRSQRA